MKNCNFLVIRPWQIPAHVFVLSALLLHVSLASKSDAQNSVTLLGQVAIPGSVTDVDVVAWYNFSAEPGTGSNAVFAGHVTWFGPGVFISLKTVTNGDEVKLVGPNGTQLTYVVSDVFQVDAYDPDSLQVMRATDDDVITIITCDGDFIDTGDAVYGGEYPFRLVVRAELAETLPGAVSAGG